MLGTEDSITLTFPRSSVLKRAIFTAIGVAAFNFVSQEASWVGGQRFGSMHNA